jgi:hypothetical protein
MATPDANELHYGDNLEVMWEKTRDEAASPCLSASTSLPFDTRPTGGRIADVLKALGGSR